MAAAVTWALGSSNCHPEKRETVAALGLRFCRHNVNTTWSAPCQALWPAQCKPPESQGDALEEVMTEPDASTTSAPSGLSLPSLGCLSDAPWGTLLLCRGTLQTLPPLLLTLSGECFSPRHHRTNIDEQNSPRVASEPHPCLCYSRASFYAPVFFRIPSPRTCRSWRRAVTPVCTLRPGACLVGWQPWPSVRADRGLRVQAVLVIPGWAGEGLGTPRQMGLQEGDAALVKSAIAFTLFTSRTTWAVCPRTNCSPDFRWLHFRPY